MKISLLHPSRSRPEKSFVNASNWLANAGCDVELLVSVDFTDPHRATYEKIYAAQCWTHNNSCVVEATNVIATKATGDILLYLSDDFECFPDWGQAVIKEFEGVTEPRLIKVDDMLQPFHVAVLTIPIMNKALYNRLGYFWHPEYKSMAVDEDLYWTARKIGALKMCPHLKFEHKHVSVGKAADDETYRRSSANWNQGKEVLARRKAQGFPV